MTAPRIKQVSDHTKSLFSGITTPDPKPRKLAVKKPTASVLYNQLFTAEQK